MKRFTNNIVSIKRGDADVDKVYKGAVQIWPDDVPVIGFPDWFENNVDGNLYLNALSDLTSTGTFDDSTQSTFGNIGTGSSRWIGGVLAPNGDIFCMPLTSSQVLRINTQTNTTTLFGSLSGSFRFVGGALAPNGFIYAAPHVAGYFMKINPDTNTITTFGSKPTNVAAFGAVCAPSGKIYCFPDNAGAPFYIIDTTNDTVDSSLFLPTGQNATVVPYSCGILAQNGKIYLVPAFSNKIAELDPNTNTIIYFGDLTLTSNRKWTDGALAPNGKIYMTPAGLENRILVLDPETKEIYFISTPTLGRNNNSATLAPDGSIYFFLQNNILTKVDTNTDIVTTNITTNIGDKSGLVLSKEGQIYTVPTSTSSILKVGVSQTIDENFPLSRHINNY